MKFKGIVIGLLAAILMVNTVMAGLLVSEAKKQTTIELATANLAYQSERYKSGLDSIETWLVAIDKEQERLRIINNQADGLPY